MYAESTVLDLVGLNDPAGDHPAGRCSHCKPSGVIHTEPNALWFQVFNTTKSGAKSHHRQSTVLITLTLEALVKAKLEALVSEMIDRGLRYDEAVGEFERKFIMLALEKSSGNQTKAAKAVGLHRNTLNKRVTSYNRTGKHLRR